VPLVGQDAQRNKQEKDTAAHKKTGCNGTASAPVLTRAPLYLNKYNDTHALRHVRYGDGRRRAWVTRGAKTLCPSQTNNNSSTLLPTKIQLSTCSMRPCARTRSAPPQQIQKHEYIHCRAVHMRAGRGGRGATAHSPESKKKQNTQLPTKDMVVGVQHVPLCPHALRSTSTNTNRYTHYCAVDMRAGEDGHGSHVVRQATLPHETNHEKKATAHS
jgi:hypothetical protein